LGVALAGAAARLALPGIQPSFGLSALRLGLTLALSAGLLSLHGRPLRGLRWQAQAATLIAADLLAFGWGLAPGTDSSVYNAPVTTAEFIQGQPPGRLFVVPDYAQEIYDEYVSLESFEPTDPAYLRTLRESLHPNQSAAHHLPAVGNYDPLTIGLYHDLYDLLEGKSDGPATMAQVQTILNLFAARYLLSGAPLDLPILYADGPYVYANESAMPEAYVVHQARIVEDPQTRLITLLDPAFDPTAEVLLSLPPTQSDSPATAQPTTEAPSSILRDGPNRVIIQADVAQAGYLVLPDTFYPGWRAMIDGEATEILPANHAFRAVALDGGQHTVVFQYEPLSFRLGAWITLGSLLLVVAIPIIRELYKRI
jgi:hypothetical protein